MQTNISKNLEKFDNAFKKLNKLTKSIIKYGTQASLALLALSAVLVVINHTVFNFNLYSEFVATSLAKTSFVILAESIIGGLLIDFIFNKG